MGGTGTGRAERGSLPRLRADGSGLLWAGVDLPLLRARGTPGRVTALAQTSRPVAPARDADH